MGNFGTPRDIRSFVNGIDYGGSFQLKEYICDFICLATKKIHVELIRFNHAGVS